MSKQSYQLKLNALQSVFSARDHSSEKLSLSKTTSNLFRPGSSAKNDNHLNLSHFNKVIHIDKQKLFAEVEGLVTYEELVSETLRFECLPSVVPELKTITVGGAIAGGGIESSSFKYGLVHETLVEFDVLLSSGKILTCVSDDENSDLFYAFPNTYGTLGYLLRAKLKLVPAKSFVKVTHRKFSEPESFFEALTKACNENIGAGSIDFIEGVIFDCNLMVITLGEFCDFAPYTNKYDREKIYYLSLKERDEDYLTVSDYIWRWDPDWFWCSRVFFMQNRWMRRLFGKWMLHSRSYAKIMHFFNRHKAMKRVLDGFFGRTESVIQDVLIPNQNAKEFFDFFRTEVGIKPVWVCPARSICMNSFNFFPLEKGKLYFDFGFWDSVNSSHNPGYFNRKIEKKTTDLKGFKSLYSISYYPENEFWQLYDKKKYEKLKSKYDPQRNLRGFFEKCTKK